MGGWTGCPASVDSLPRPLGETTLRTPWSAGLTLDNAMDASHSSTIRLSVKEKYFDFFSLKSGERGDVSRGGGRGNAGIVEVSLAVTMPAHLEKGEKRALGVQLRSRFTFRKIWGDNKYSNDSSVPQHPQPKLTTSPDVECQQQPQRSELWGAEAASTAWLNGAGDFPSPPLPSRHSQSLLGKSGARPVSQAAREC